MVTGLVAALAVLLVTPAPATDWFWVDLDCPIDGTRFRGLVVASIFVPGCSSDFRPLGVGVDGYLERLPDAGEGKRANEVLAVWKVRISGHLTSRESLSSLVRAYESGGPLMLEAAISLLRRGDPRGKDLVVEDVQGVLDRFRDELDLLIPFLAPGDFDRIREQMEALSREEAEEDQPEAHEYLRLLGATRNPKAKVLLASFLGRRDRPSLRQGAVEGLGYVYDDQIAARFQKIVRDISTDFGTVDAILRVIARVKDAKQVDLLLSLVREPTPVGIKEAWSEAMRAVARDAAVPSWRSWSKSPDAGLRRLATECLSGR